MSPPAHGDYGFEAWRRTQSAALESALEKRLPRPNAPPAALHKAMRWGVLGGGKRLRPLLCLAAAEACAGGPVPAAMPLACAIEFLHSYSLVHDDLPALDNDDLRRGRPTCHRQFGEAMAILAGDGLLTLAFAQFSDPVLLKAVELPEPAPGLPAGVARQSLGGMLAIFAAAAGTPEGMLAGQADDLTASAEAATGAATPLETVTAIHRRKTAALIRAALVLGGAAGGARPAQMQALESAGADLGLAFQITDDVLDVTGNARTLGKSPGKDAAQHKLTYPALVGISASLQQAQILGGAALDRLDAAFPTAAPLYRLSEMLVRRNQ